MARLGWSHPLRQERFQGGKNDLRRNFRRWQQRGRPDATVGIAGVVNGISNAHIAFLNAGGLGVLIGDGQLTQYGTEKMLEAYYSYALTPSTRLTLDYQVLINLGYNADRGPVNIFAARAHWQF
jgi:high affinity Mn2+ porin